MLVSNVSRGLVPNACFTALVLLLSMPAAFAQATRTVTQSDIERAERSQPVITEQDIKRARKNNRMPTDAELRTVPVPSTPNVDALPQPKTARPPDLEAIARGYQAAGGPVAQLQRPTSGPGLLVFVSFSMPHKTLERLVDQAARARASLVLRGFSNGSLQETVLGVQRVIGQREVAFQIDPQAFDRFAIAKTPTFVLVRDGAQPKPCSSGQCFATEAFVSTAGDVSLEYALEHIQRTAPTFSREAAQFLKLIRS